MNRIKQASPERGPDDFVFRLRNGEWIRHVDRVFKDLLKEADLLYADKGQEREMYSLRAFYANARMKLGRVPLPILAENMGTSIAMLQGFYANRIMTMENAEILAFSFMA